MNWLTKLLMGQMLLMDEKDGKDGGGGGGGGNDAMKALTDRLDKMEKENAELKAKLTPKNEEDQGDLAEKAKKEREETDKKKASEKTLESALNFLVGAPEWQKVNGPLMPKTVEGIFAQAEKENYGSKIDKANAIKVGIVQEFFALQSNHDLLTAGQKIELADFLALTKNVRQERVDNIYAMIFEPTLKYVKDMEKAKQLNNGAKNETDGEKALAERMKKMSQKHYLGEKYGT